MGLKARAARDIRSGDIILREALIPLMNSAGSVLIAREGGRDRTETTADICALWTSQSILVFILGRACVRELGEQKPICTASTFESSQILP